MGWASGFRAGSELARTAMDTYYDVKKKTEMGNLERDLQRQQEERQAELDAYNANVAIAQQQPQATQVGLGQQFNPQQSLVMPQQQVPQLRGVNQVAPGQMSPVSGQALGLGVAPTEMSDASIERMRAQQLRGLGYTEEADKALSRALQMEDIDYRKQQDRLAEERAMRGEVREETRLDRAGQLFDMQLKKYGFEIKELEQQDAAREALAKFSGMTAAQILTSPDYLALPPQVRNAVVGVTAEMTKNELDATLSYVKQEVNKYKDFGSLLTFVNDEDTITKGSTWVSEPQEKGGFNFYLRDDATGEALTTPMPFDNENQANQYLRALVVDPVTAGTYYETVFQNMSDRAAAAAAAGREDRQFAIEQIVKLQAEFNDAESIWGNMARTNPEELANIKRSVFAPFKSMLSEKEFTELTGGKPDPTDGESKGILELLGLGGSNPSESESDKPPRYGATLDEQFGVPARAVAGEISSNVVEPISQGLYSMGARQRVYDRINKGFTTLPDLALEDLLAARVTAEGKNLNIINAEIARREMATELRTRGGNPLGK